MPVMRPVNYQLIIMTPPLMGGCMVMLLSDVCRVHRA